MNSLPTDSRPTTPNEVGTVVWVECDRNIVARYSKGSIAAQIICHVSVIDFEKKIIIDQKTFEGSMPTTPSQITYIGRGGGYNQIYGSKPDDDIAKYLRSLPRR